MALFDFLKKKKAPENNTVKNDHGNPAVWESADAIFLGNQAYLDKIQGSLVGGAIGDAFGYPVEFLSLDEIKQKYGLSGITKYELDKQTGTAVISDDTQMTLFTATGLLVGDTRLSMRGIAGEPSSYVFLSYLNWMETQGITIADPFRVSWLMDVRELYVRRAPGNTCLSALGGRTHKSEYATIQKPINESKGCGGVMRVAPVGLFYNIPNIRGCGDYTFSSLGIYSCCDVGAYY